MTFSSYKRKEIKVFFMSSITSNMNSCRPYLLRAIYNWITDNRLTPYLLVDATLPHVLVPQDFVQEGRIVLNMAPLAVKDLVMDAQVVKFSARFNQVVQQVYVPTPAVLGIYAKENGRGMFFDSVEFQAEVDEFVKMPQEKVSEVFPVQRKKPKLTIVKNTPSTDKPEPKE
jgi:stringent starvation protein B